MTKIAAVTLAALLASTSAHAGGNHNNFRSGHFHHGGAGWVAPLALGVGVLGLTAGVLAAGAGAYPYGYGAAYIPPYPPRPYGAYGYPGAAYPGLPNGCVTSNYWWVPC